MLNGLFNIGQTALNASQAWISVTGNNLANADTDGYSRQYVDQKDAGGLTYKPGAQPLGVNAAQIMRYFDAFLERAYVNQSSTSSRWDEHDMLMTSVENIFNEANRTGLGSAMTNFFNAWQDLALRPEDTSVRQSLLSYADNLADMFSTTMDSLKSIQNEIDMMIRKDVDRVNELAKSIAELNQQITSTTIDGMSNPNALLDKRDQMVRELATLVDVETIDHGKGNFRVQLTTGQPLVDGPETYSLAVGGINTEAENRLIGGSKYDGKVTFEGTDSHEYTIDITKDGKDGNPPEFRVSLDGGKTWFKDEKGNDLTFQIKQSVDKDGNPVVDADGNPVYDPIQVKNLKISFSTTDNLTVGDKFDIMPKTGLYWIEPTRGPQNITPQITMNGQDNPNRVTGGKLAAYYNVRDDNIGRYVDELDAVASSLIWEVNRIHSQGAGQTMLNYAQGQQRVENTTAALGSEHAILPNYDKLQDGYVNFHFYADDGDKSYQGSATLSFSRADSLEDVVQNLNALQIGIPDGNGNTIQVNPFKASIQDGKLLIEKNPAATIITDPAGNQRGFDFALGEDSSGLMAALGINTFFAGSGAADIGVTSQIHQDTRFIAAGAVNGQFEVNAGDNITATAIGKLIDKPVTINTFWKTVDNQTLGQYYANLVTTVGSDRRLSKTNAAYHATLASDLFDRAASVSGVNMDEEMSNLIKFQHSYTAAAKLITTADQMLQTLLGIKQ